MEKTLLFDNDDEVDSLSVLEVLDSVTEVKNEYKNLQKDIKEVQQLQREMTASLQYQMRTMKQTFNLLKKRIELRTEPPPSLSIRSQPTTPAHNWKKWIGSVMRFHKAVANNSDAIRLNFRYGFFVFDFLVSFVQHFVLAVLKKKKTNNRI